MIDTWHVAAGGRLGAAVSVSAPQRVSPDYFAELDALSRRHGLPFDAHMLETKFQRALRHLAERREWVWLATPDAIADVIAAHPEWAV